MARKILITGSTGFVGRHLVPKLLDNDFQVLEITRSQSKSLKLFGDITSKIEISDPLLKEKIKDFNPEVAIHLASYLTSSDSLAEAEKLISSNITFLTKILDALSDTSLKLFINTGSFSEFYKGNDEFIPAYFYAATKTASRAIVDYYSNLNNFTQVTVVPYTIYGGKDSQKKIIDIIYDSTFSKTPLDLTPGDQFLDFIHIDDVVDFYISIISKLNSLPKKVEFKLGTGNPVSLKQLAKLIEVISNKKINVNWGGKKYRQTDILFAKAEIDKNKEMLLWVPKINLETGLKKYINNKP